LALCAVHYVSFDGNFPVMDCLRKYICASWFDFVACCAIIRGFLGFFVFLKIISN